MKQMNTENKESKGYRALLLLLVALAIFSSAMKDVQRLQELTCSLEQLAGSVMGHGLFSASAATISATEAARLKASQETATAGEFRWTGRLAQGKTIEIKGLNGNIAADAASGADVELVATKRANSSDANLVSIKVVEHADGVTICAIYPTSDPNQTSPCEPGKGITDSTQQGNIVVRKNDVRVDFKIRVPAGVNVTARTVNGEVSAETLASNVSAKTVNGSIRISTTGYAQAKTVNGEISARLGNFNWPGSLEFKTVNGAINIDLPVNVNTSVQAKTLNGSINSDFPLTLLGKFGRRELNGTIGPGGSGGRELILKTINGTINLRRAG